MEKQHWYLTDEEVQFIRSEINKRRVPGAYEPGKWSVSRYNRDPEITGNKFPKSVVLRDITLRTAEQTPVVSLTWNERLRLAEALLEAGVRSMQFSWTLVGEGWTSPDFVKYIRELAQNVELVVTGVTSKEQIDSVAEAGIDVAACMNPSVPAITPIYYPEVPKMAWLGEDWRKKYNIKSVEDQIEWISELVQYAKKVGVKSSAGINMLSYSTAEYLERYCSAVAQAEPDYISLMDGSGGMGPEAWEYVVSLIRRVAPEPLVNVHPHNPFGLGVANAIGAVKGGANVVEVSVNRLCSASGQADLAEVAATLEVLYGVDTAIRLEKLTSLRRLVEDITGVKMAQNKAVTGERAWAYSENFLAIELPVEPLLHYCVEPSVFGNSKSVLLGKNADQWSVLGKLKELGVEISRELVSPALKSIRAEISIRKRALKDEEIQEIVEKVKASSAR